MLAVRRQPQQRIREGEGIVGDGADPGWDCVRDPYTDTRVSRERNQSTIAPAEYYNPLKVFFILQEVTGW